MADETLNLNLELTDVVNKMTHYIDENKRVIIKKILNGYFGIEIDTWGHITKINENSKFLDQVNPLLSKEIKQIEDKLNNELVKVAKLKSPLTVKLTNDIIDKLIYDSKKIALEKILEKFQNEIVNNMVDRATTILCEDPKIKMFLIKTL